MSGHDSPAYLPNMLAFVAGLGLRAGDDDRVDEALELLCAHQDADGRFISFGRAPGHPEPRWRRYYLYVPHVEDRELAEPSWWSPEEREGEWDAIGVGGPGPSVAFVSETASPGPYRTCTANPRRNFCAELTVTP